MAAGDSNEPSSPMKEEAQSGHTEEDSGSKDSNPEQTTPGPQSPAKVDGASPDPAPLSTNQDSDDLEAKSGRKSCPEFLIKLVTMLRVENPDIMSWEDGRIHFRNPSRLVNEVLKRYFRHANYNSFKRQLNYFGFRKVEGKGKMEPCVYTNEELEGQNLDEILAVKRKTNVGQDQLMYMPSMNKMDDAYPSAKRPKVEGHAQSMMAGPHHGWGMYPDPRYPRGYPYHHGVHPNPMDMMRPPGPAGGAPCPYGCTDCGASGAPRPPAPHHYGHHYGHPPHYGHHHPMYHHGPAMYGHPPMPMMEGYPPADSFRRPGGYPGYHLHDPHAMAHSMPHHYPGMYSPAHYPHHPSTHPGSAPPPPMSPKTEEDAPLQQDGEAISADEAPNGTGARSSPKDSSTNLANLLTTAEKMKDAELPPVAASAPPAGADEPPATAAQEAAEKWKEAGDDGPAPASTPMSVVC